MTHRKIALYGILLFGSIFVFFGILVVQWYTISKQCAPIMEFISLEDQEIKLFEKNSADFKRIQERKNELQRQNTGLNFRSLIKKD